MVNLNMCFHVGNESVRVTTLITNMKTIFCVIISADDFVQMSANVFNTCTKTPLLFIMIAIKLVICMCISSKTKIFINLYASDANELAKQLCSDKHIDKYSKVFSSQNQARVWLQCEFLCWWIWHWNIHRGGRRTLHFHSRSFH